MTLVSNDPSWWYVINANRTGSYFMVVASVGVLYDSVLTFAQEVELIWKQRWSLMTVLYLSLRYIGILYAVISILMSLPTFPMTDTGCWIMFSVQSYLTMITPVILGVIMVVRLYAMYQRSRKVLILLIVIFLVINISGVVIFAIILGNVSTRELILSGAYQCSAQFEGNDVLLGTMYAMLIAIWETLALCFAGCIAVKHFRELQRHSAAGMISDCYKILIKSHCVYFASCIAVSCCLFVYPVVSAAPYSLGTQIYYGILQICVLVQSFVLGPRLILSVREYYANVAEERDAISGMISIAFHERVHVKTNSSV